MADLSFFDKWDIRQALERVETLLSSGIFSPENSQNPLFRSAFIELLIGLRDLMYKAEKYGERIAFRDDVKPFGRVVDVTDLIKNVRDAICHPDSANNFIHPNSIKATFNVGFGKCAVLSMGDFEQRCMYDDDALFAFGLGEIYLKRHIVRAYEEARKQLLPLVQQP